MKALEIEPHSIEDSERAAGLGSYKAPKKRKIETQPMSDDEFDSNDEDVEMKTVKAKKLKVLENEDT